MLNFATHLVVRFRAIAFCVVAAMDWTLNADLLPDCFAAAPSFTATLAVTIAGKTVTAQHFFAVSWARVLRLACLS
mgnify:CR=1 FL=1